MVSLMYPKFLNIRESLATLQAETFVLVSVYFVLKYATLQQHLFNALAFSQLASYENI